MHPHFQEAVALNYKSQFCKYVDFSGFPIKLEDNMSLQT